jgi:hypothetical protein
MNSQRLKEVEWRRCEGRWEEATPNSTNSEDALAASSADLAECARATYYVAVV